MYRDLSEIRQFYQSALGRLTAKTLERKIRSFWSEPLNKNTCLAGIGYALPYLDAMKSDKTIAVMPPALSGVHWPSRGANRTVLTDEHVLPFADQSIEKILLVHAVENADYLRELMDEVWRVLEPNGRVLLIVPNRSGLWAKSDRTPFGYGRPFSMKQVRQLLYDLNFVIEDDKRALYFLPSHNRVMLGLAPVIEILGEMIVPRLGGVTLIEASKRLYHGTPLRVSSPLPRNGGRKSEWVTEPVPT